MAQKLYLRRLLMALIFFGSLLSISLIFSTFSILSSRPLRQVFVHFSIAEVNDSSADTATKTFGVDYDFWAKYYNDDRFGRTWSFNISQKYDVSQLCEYKPVVVVQKDAGRPGEMGSAPYIPPDKDKLINQLIKEHHFNLLASNMMSVQRSFPDIRYPECKNITYMTALPAASVIIIYHNEQWTLIVRTIWGIINKSPRELLKEIILVNDLSDLNYLDKPLDDYLELLPAKVVHIRTKKREGLTRARIIGAQNATGNVLVFFDAHVDCFEGWLEPILNRIANDRSVIAIPHINDIELHRMNLRRTQTNDEYHFIWNWNLLFRSISLTANEMKRRHNDKTVPLRTVTMIGCAFAVDRKFFFEIGAYDEGLDIWGSENMEISLRAWQCGGSMEIIPCSHTTHLSRTSTYSLNGDMDLVKHRNNVRVAEVWMDDYKELYYLLYPGTRNIKAGDLTERKELRKKLKCNNFQWMLDNVYTQSVMRSGYINMGQIANKSGSHCFDIHHTHTRGQRPVIHNNVSIIEIRKCDALSNVRQGMVYLKSKLIAYIETGCVGLGKELPNQNKTQSVGILSVDCDPEDENQKWDMNEKDGFMSIKHIKTGLCMHSSKSDSIVLVRQCDSCDRQQWKWKSTLPIKSNAVDKTSNNNSD